MHHNTVVNLARASRAFKPPAKGSAPADLIVAAERLFAERGIEGVSLRTICVESKQGNTRALQYHFGDRQGIVAAIMLTRMARLEQRRSELLDATIERGTPDIATLLGVLLRPISEFAGADGRNLFARFLLHITTHSHAWGWGPSQHIDFPEVEPTATERAYDLLRQRIDPQIAWRVDNRMSHILRMFLGALIDRENTVLDGGEEVALEEVVQDQILMAAAALCAVPAA
ncbi:TetR/AcrR family transcriptional regulator [Novosphingobium sp. BL-52-GroH]|uniref:TetR/AcrR family transcriptional regulator n=1 Tax=Novosphingobium sp. BL-52-GroH TaxID=3349877 RepID=UPI00384D862F